MGHASKGVLSLGFAALAYWDKVVVIFSATFGGSFGVDRPPFTFRFCLTTLDGNSGASGSSRIRVSSGFERRGFLFPLLGEFISKLDLPFLTASVQIKDAVLAIGKVRSSAIEALRYAQFAFSSFAEFAIPVVLSVIVRAGALRAAHNIRETIKVEMPPTLTLRAMKLGFLLNPS